MPLLAEGGAEPAAASAADAALRRLCGLAASHFSVDLALVTPDAEAAAWPAGGAGAPLPQPYAHCHFHAACALEGADGRPLGAFRLLRRQPRPWSGEDVAALRDFAALAAAVMAQRSPPAGDASWRDEARKLELAVEGSGTGVWDRNVVTGQIHYSAGWKALLGYGPHELSDRIEDAYGRLHPDDAAYVREAMQAHFDGKTDAYEVEHRVRCKNGSYKWICSRGKVVSRDAQGRALRMIGTTTDITAMRVMAERLQRTADLVVNLTDAVPGLVFQFRYRGDGDSRFTYVSAGIADMFGLTPAEAVADPLAVERRVHAEDLAAYRASLRAAMAGQACWRLEFRVCLPGLGTRWRQGEARPQTGPDGDMVWHGFITDITDRKRAEFELRELAATDALTALPNRRHFMARIAEELARIRRHGGPDAAVLMCDLDHFKRINDTWGHAAGDSVLQQFAQTLRGQLRTSDVGGRIGGEEFAVLLPGAALDDAHRFAVRLQECVAASSFTAGGRGIALTVSIGIAAMHWRDENAELALNRSDRALYNAKQRGLNRIEWQADPPAGASR